MYWKKLSPTGDIPSPRSGHSGVALPSKHMMYIFGGFYARQGGILSCFTDLYAIKFAIHGSPKWKKITANG